VKLVKDTLKITLNIKYSEIQINLTQLENKYLNKKKSIFLAFFIYNKVGQGHQKKTNYAVRPTRKVSCIAYSNVTHLVSQVWRFHFILFQQSRFHFFSLNNFFLKVPQ
jgi:hypothetical protein